MTLSNRLVEQLLKQQLIRNSIKLCILATNFSTVFLTISYNISYLNMLCEKDKNTYRKGYRVQVLVRIHCNKSDQNQTLLYS